MPLKMFAQKEKKQEKRTQVIAVAAGKGGVGKSALTVNLALALYRRGYSVGIMDADLYGPSVRWMLPEEILPTQKGSEMIPAEAHGIKMISMAHFRMENEAALIRAPIANGIITQFLEQVQWGELDYLLIDFPPGTGDIHITISQKARLTGALLVTTPQEVALLDVVKCMNMFEKVQVPILGLVENMSYFIQTDGNKVFPMGTGGGEALAKEKGYPLLGAIPLHPLIGKTLDQGRSLFEMPGKEAEALQEIYSDIAAKVVAEANLLNGRDEGVLDRFELVFREMQ